jgi:hypothetical protein
MSISLEEAGLAFFIAAIGLIGGFLGNIIAGTFQRWRQIAMQGTQSRMDLRNEFLIEIILFAVLVAALVLVGNALMH